MSGGNKINELKLEISYNDQSKNSVKLSTIYDDFGGCFIDVNSIKDTNVFIYDNGYTRTASCKSSISYIDGEEGVLLYRGKRIEEVAKDLSLIDAMFLVIYGKLPIAHEKESFINRIKDIYFDYNWSDVEKIVDRFDQSSHPMSIVMTIFSYLSSRRLTTSLNLTTEQIAEELIFAIATMFKATVLSQRRISNISSYKSIANKNDNNLALIFMQDLLNTTNVSKEQVEVMDKMLVLHLEHGQNASTTSVRNTTSTGVGLFAAITSGIASLWGPLHGGANEAVIHMLHTIGDIKNAHQYIEEVKAGVDGKKLMGFGHRIYKNYDPRAAVIKKYCDNLLQKKQTSEQQHLLEIATTIEKEVLKDEYFISRKLFPNVDFYSGITYQSLGISVPMFIVMFATSRVTGWVSHWREMVTEGNIKIARPRQVYIGKV